jgi:Zn-dependent protease
MGKIWTSFTFGRLAGIPLRVHINWFLTAFLVSWSLAAGYFPQGYPGWQQVAYWLTGITTAMLFFASVLLHELGHARVALHEKVPVENITLFIFGGVAHIAYEPKTPGSEFRIVVAGPLTSLLLAAIFFGLSRLLLPYQALSAACFYLGSINLILAFFNLIPGFPLDGGRLLRSLIWKLLKDFNRATRWATNVGFVIAFLFVLAGAAFAARGNWIGGLWVAFIGGYLGVVARGARLQIEEDTQLKVERPRNVPLPQAVPCESEIPLVSGRNPCNQ